MSESINCYYGKHLECDDDKDCKCSCHINRENPYWQEKRDALQRSRN